MAVVSTYKTVVVGASGVGKTAIVQRLVDKTFSDESQPTIGVEFKCFETKSGNDSIKLNIWDTAGQEKFRAVSKAYFRNAVGAVLVFSLTDKQSFEDLDAWMNDIHALCASNAVVLVVGNKSDLRDERCVSESDAQSFAERHGIEYIETSALDGANVSETFVRLAHSVHERAKKGDIRGNFTGNSGNIIVTPNSEEAPARASAQCC